ncbi:MAG: T9SS C-terminal target domain-containing protein, partial [Bacteroidetes bacterium]
TATAGADFTFSSPDTVIFTSGGSTVATLAIPIISDALVEPSESFVIRVDSLSGCSVGSTDSVTVTILDDDIPTPVYPIGLVTADANADGVADSLNVICEVRGVVYGVDLRGGNGVQFSLRGQGHGIGVFTTLATVGYDVVTEGDSLHVIGKVEQFNGLAQMGTLDTIIVKAAARPLEAAVVVDSLGEFTEHELVTIECVTLVNPAQWTGTGSGFTAAITNGTTTFDLRVDNDVTLYSQPAPTGYFSVTGLGGQFDSSVPRTSGYQLLPRYIADLVVAPAPVVSLERGTLSVVEQNTTISTDVTFAGLNPDSTEVWVYLDTTASTATAGLDFTFTNDTLYKDGPCGSSALDSVTVSILDDGLVEGDETVVLYIAAVVNGVVGAVDTVTITITDNLTDAVSDLLPADAISLYPNPGREQVNIEGTVRIESIRMTELSGKVVLNRQVNGFQTSLSTEALSGGVYLIEATTAEGRWIQKWVKVQP